MINCFLNYVGLAYCEMGAGFYDAPISGRYLNKLPGISIEIMDNVADAEQTTFMGLWDDIQSTTIPKFRLDIIEEINKCYQFECDCVYDDLICENVEQLGLAWEYKLAQTLMVFIQTSDRVNRWTTVDAARAKTLYEYYGNEYALALKQAVKCLDTSSCCLKCSGNPEFVTWLP